MVLAVKMHDKTQFGKAMKVASDKKTYSYRRTKTGVFDIPAAEKPFVEASNLELRHDFHRQKLIREKNGTF